MSGAGPILILLASLGLLALGLALNWWLANQRRSEMNALALRLGWEWDPGPNPDFDDQFRQFDCFRTGGDREAANTLRGWIKVRHTRYPALMGDYKFTRTHSNGKSTSKSTHRFSYALVQVPFHVPDLLLRREHFLDKAAAFLGFEDINFESSEFSRRFFVKSADKKFAYDVVHPRMMDFLLRVRPPAIDLRSDWLLIMDGERRWRPDDFAARISWAEQFLELWPDYLIQQLRPA
jgi:hypothetical protein